MSVATIFRFDTLILQSISSDTELEVKYSFPKLFKFTPWSVLVRNLEGIGARVRKIFGSAILEGVRRDLRDYLNFSWTTNLKSGELKGSWVLPMASKQLCSRIGSLRKSVFYHKMSQCIYFKSLLNAVQSSLDWKDLYDVGRHYL